MGLTTINHLRRSPKLGSRGFTLAELCIGLIVTTLVGAALSAFVLAVGDRWRYADGVQAESAIFSQLSGRLQSRYQDAKRVGLWRSGSSGDGSAAMVYWRGDLNGDQQMQLSELAVIQYNSATATIEMLTPAASNDGTDPQWTPQDLRDNSAIGRVSAGGTSTPLVHHVASATLDVLNSESTTLSPTVQWNVGLTAHDGSTTNQSVVVTFRAPTTPE